MQPSFLIEVIKSDLSNGTAILLKSTESAGMVVPLNWTKYAPQLDAAWGKFMEGQTFIESGFFVSDVLKFLKSKVKNEASMGSN